MGFTNGQAETHRWAYWIRRTRKMNLGRQAQIWKRKFRTIWVKSKKRGEKRRLNLIDNTPRWKIFFGRNECHWTKRLYREIGEVDDPVQIKRGWNRVVLHRLMNQVARKRGVWKLQMNFGYICSPVLKMRAHRLHWIKHLVLSAIPCSAFRDP